MAQLKDTVVTGNIRVTNEVLANSVQTSTIKIPTTSGSTTLGPGTAGQVIKSDGTGAYWAADSNTDTNVTQNIKTDNVDRPLLMANYATGSTASAATTVNRAQSIYANASTGKVTATTFAGDFSGTINSTTTATTQSQGDNSTKVATTAYVDAAVPTPAVSGTVLYLNSADVPS